MKHISDLLIKFIMVTLVLEVILGMMTNLALSNILIISLAVTILAYIIGDLLILPPTNNTTATIADIGLALAVIYMFNFLWNTREISFVDALIAAAVIGSGEWFFHKYVANNVIKKRQYSKQ
ncbi:YndM family protein [Clostridium swellfunianum]|uniref:DUF2512 family protein n=1 Tax=Clostridium swellfunianum TaxID=1367462 RepID=UPI00203093EE|nr:DUF2512 family protein [Clostridium swellfunianum]MCM0648242.1 YndM family protein [Clostridium swellfunianum]